MLFNSVEFALFFPVVTILFFLLPHRFRWMLLLAASCFFYMFFKPIYILILVFTIVIDYFAGIWIAREADRRKKKYLLMLSIAANVGVLAVFKYYNFIAININEVLDSVHRTGNIPLLSILLPIGLSFHTFQAMSYTIEIYRGHQQPERHFGIYALYVMFYPQLVAGPIERPQNILHQFHEVKHFDYENMRSGLIQIAWGLFKKVVIADRLALFVNQVYGNPFGYTGLPLIIATIFFAFQIYCDFSGYSDIAIGTARCMGYKLMTNFNKPYRATGIAEFWQRWHISLSTWFRDYVYIPLGGNRVPVYRWALNIMIVFMLSGAWHGANWTFVVWGALHGIYLIVERIIRRGRKKDERPAGWPVVLLRRAVVFTAVSFAWVFFRAQNLAHAKYIIRNLFVGLPEQLRDVVHNLHFARLRLVYLNQSLNDLVIALIVLLFLIMIQSMQKDQPIDKWLESRPRAFRLAFYYGVPLAFISLGIFNRSDFIYFQF
ncbi:MAG TPA: MBOAT family O-acyltransferase [Puia sp.]|jgi:D-alanyl-lipoteichoic acid acyltransferase DltB (MBOAT superfamily)|nr:MBOAT family O-acyltransferase [Puia sp.]